MNILILVDKPINRTLLGHVQLKVSDLYRRNADIEINWFTEERDFSNLPKEVYWGGFEGIRTGYLRAQCETIYEHYAEEIDQVVFLVHSDNWNLNGVWGWNVSTLYSGYGVQQVRFAQRQDHSDQRNINNTAGTLYHELHHDHDGFIYVYLDKLVEPLVEVDDWDHEVTHGNSPLWEYIRYDENQFSINLIAPLLREALAKRRSVYQKKVGLMQQVIQLAQQAIILLRQQIAAQRGDLPILEDNKCLCQRSQKTARG